MKWVSGDEMKMRSVSLVALVLLLSLTGLVKGAETEMQLCTPHQLPLDQCFYCDPTLRDPGRLWCGEHDRYEDRCFICHPDLKEADRLFCDEHHLYEDECIFCHPELARQDIFSASKEKTAQDSEQLQCLEHRVAEEDCGICHPDLLPGLAVGEGLLIRFESPLSAGKAGVRTALPTEGKALTGLQALGRVTYDLNHFIQIAPRVEGVVQRVLVDVGEDVVQGQPLVEMDSSKVALAKNDYLSSMALTRLKQQVFTRAKKLSVSRASSQKEYERAFAEYEVAKHETGLMEQRLHNLGLTTEQIRLVEQTGSISSMVQITAPFSGTLVERGAVVGEIVQPGDRLITLADLSTMWLEIFIPEDRLHLVGIGDFVEASFATIPQGTHHGRVSWIAPAVDERSRMVQGRAVVKNPDHHLKHGMFASLRITPHETGRNLQVPVAALQNFEGRSFVFIKTQDDLFEIRRVQVGGRDTVVADILAGISPKEQLVVEHSFTLKSEYLKSRLGAGCVDD